MSDLDKTALTVFLCGLLFGVGGIVVGNWAAHVDARNMKCPPQNYLQLQDGQRIYFSTQAGDYFLRKDGGQ